MILEFRNPVTITSLRNSSLKLENLWTIKIWCSSLEMLENHQVAVIVIWHIRQTRQWWKEKTRYEVQELLVAEYETDGKKEIYYQEDLELLVSGIKRKERYVPRNWNLMKRYKKHLPKFVQGDFWWVRSRRISTRKIYRNASVTELVIKNKKFIDNSSQINKRGSFEDMQNNGRNLKHFISGSSGLGKSRFAKIGKKN